MGEMGKAQVLGEDGVTFPREVIGCFLLPYPTLLYLLLPPPHYFFLYHFICEYLIINYNTIIALKNMNTNSLLSCNIRLVITFQGRVLSGQEHGLICLLTTS